MFNAFSQFENQELIEKLIKNGYGDIVEAFLSNDNEIYTKKGRLNKSGACRLLNCKPKELEDAIKSCQELLHKEMGDDTEED